MFSGVGGLVSLVETFFFFTESERLSQRACILMMRYYAALCKVFPQ